MSAPVLAVGHGALGFWAALREVFLQTREQRCWFHKTWNVLNALPKPAQPDAKTSLMPIWNAVDKDHAAAAAKAFADAYGAKWPKAIAKITGDLDMLLAFYDYPGEHEVHLRTTNPIELTVRLRQRVTKGPGSRAAGVAMAFKFIDSAGRRWRDVNSPHLVALVRADAIFHKGILVERPPAEGRARLVLGHVRPAGAAITLLRAGLITPSATQQGASHVKGHDPEQPYQHVCLVNGVSGGFH